MMADSLAGSIWIQPCPTTIPRNLTSVLLNSHFDNLSDSPRLQNCCKTRQIFRSSSRSEVTLMARLSM